MCFCPELVGWIETELKATGSYNLVYFTMIRGRSLLIKSRSKVKVVDR
jgi:hypothetical protein